MAKLGISQKVTSIQSFKIVLRFQKVISVIIIHNLLGPRPCFGGAANLEVF